MFLFAIGVPMFLATQLMRGPTPQPVSTATAQTASVAQSGGTTYYGPPQEPKRRSCDPGMLCQIAENGYYGCLSADVEARIGSYSEQGDEETFSRALRRALATGQCVRWREGDKVRMQDTRLFRVCLRRPSEESCYWTPREAVKI